MLNRVIRKSLYITLILVGVLVPVVNAYADGDTTDFSITVNPSLNLSVSKAISGFSVTPSKNGTYDSDSFNVISSTNNATGYTLTMSVDDTDLVSETINVNTGDPLTIPTLTKTQDGITAAQFEASTDSSVLNHYGISIAGANYNAMESPKTILETSENNTTSDVTAISLAAKLDLLTVPAIYSTTINFQMTANPLPDTLESAYAKANKQKATVGGQQYYSIQDMNSTICADVDIEDDELQVYDNRDNKIYWIAKLADGHCWMTQNLDLDLVTVANGDPLYNHDNTDLGWGGDSATTSWNPENATIAVSNGTFSGWTNDYNNPYSADPGDWYWDGDYSSSSCKYLTNASCTHFSNSSSTFNNGIHGHVGNYYNWTAAIASNDSSSYTSDTMSDISGNPQNSICPAGWRLPTVSSASDTTGSTNEFKRLTTLYGNNTSNDTDLIDSPLYFVRGGNVNGSGSLSVSGFYGSYWSSTVLDSSYARDLGFSSGSVNPLNYSTRVSGVSVRCIAR